VRFRGRIEVMGGREGEGKGVSEDGGEVCERGRVEGKERKGGICEGKSKEANIRGVRK